MPLFIGTKVNSVSAPKAVKMMSECAVEVSLSIFIKMYGCMCLSGGSSGCS